MPTFRVFVSDTITFERSHMVAVEADDAAAACSRAIQDALDGKFHMVWEENEIDTTPYDAVIADPE